MNIVIKGFNMSRKVIWFLLSTTVISTLFAETKVERSGNVNVNVIDRKVIVNGKVVKTIPEGEPVSVNVENGKVKVNGEVVERVGNSSSNIGASINGGSIGANVGDVGAKIDGNKIGASIGNGIGASINGDSISANVGGISASIDGDNIRANIGGILNSAIKRRKNRDKSKDSDFFGGDDFFK